MVSPSKIQHQQQQQRPQEKLTRETNSSSHFRIQKGPKPLERKSFYLDIKNHVLSAKLEAKIKELGGAIEVFLVRSVTLVVSDRSDKSSQASADRRKWGYASGGSGGPPSLRSIEAPTPTPTPTPPTPYHSVEGPLSNSTNQRGQTAQRSKSRVDAMLERALTQPHQCSVDPINNAISWGIPIWHTFELQAWLEKICASLKDTNNLKRQNRIGSGKDLKVKHLKEPYIKFESYRRESRPVFLELQSWPTLNFDGDPGSCPFDVKRREKKESFAVLNKEIKENKEKSYPSNIPKGKEMTRRPRATATRARRTEHAGYCEICRIDYQNLSKHLQSEQHLNFVRNDANFLALDTLISTGASVEAFLKLNRNKDVSAKNCNPFTNGDHSHMASEEKEKSPKGDLKNFSVVDEMKMVQCNGARRNLNLKLSSPHNLRTRSKPNATSNHGSGHLLRSKSRPINEVEKSEKSFDKYTIKKRSKGTIWIEEEDDEEEGEEEEEEKERNQQEQYLQSPKESVDRLTSEKGKTNRLVGANNYANNESVEASNLNSNGASPDSVNRVHDCDVNKGAVEDVTKFIGIGLNECKLKVNGFEKTNKELPHGANKMCVSRVKDLDRLSYVANKSNENCAETHPNGVYQEDCQKMLKLSSPGERPRSTRGRGRGRSNRGRNRLSVEERLIEDNRAYYKVEVLGNKLRSNAIPFGCGSVSSLSKEVLDKPKKEDAPSSEKPVVVRFKRVRKSELSLLSDEAESFMFGEPRRDDSSEASDDEQSSVLPKDTESELDETAAVRPASSPIPTSSPQKQEIVEEDSQDSATVGRARKRRRTQAEALIMDNADYYKFETPGSRLRYQAPITGIREPSIAKEVAPATPPPPPPLPPPSPPKPPQDTEAAEEEVPEKFYPSRPSLEVEKMQFSFEAVPRSEPWYQTYQRQDDGEEFWHYFSESDTRRPFVLPYEIENFHDILNKSLHRGEPSRRRGRGRGSRRGGLGRGLSRLPRKSPRCHASTLAIMSTIIRKREQQQQQTTISVIPEESPTKTVSEPKSDKSDKSDKKSEPKSDVDEELKLMAKNIDEMLCTKEIDDSFEPDMLEPPEDPIIEPDLPKGAPLNLLELLENCQDITNTLENSSCASSECGEQNFEFPMRRRKKKRKNKTGWPGKMRRKPPLRHILGICGKRSEVEAEKILTEDSRCVELPEQLISNQFHDDENDKLMELTQVEPVPDLQQVDSEVFNLAHNDHDVEDNEQHSIEYDKKENDKEVEQFTITEEQNDSNSRILECGIEDQNNGIDKEESKRHPCDSEILDAAQQEDFVNDESQKEISAETNDAGPKKQLSKGEETPKKNSSKNEETPKKSPSKSEEAPKKQFSKSEETPKKLYPKGDEISKKQVYKSEETPKKNVWAGEETPKKNTKPEESLDRTLSNIEEDSETSITNDENQGPCSKDANAIITLERPTKITRKRQRASTVSSDTHECHVEYENQDSTTPMKDTSTDSPRKFNNINYTPKKLQKNNTSDSHDSPIKNKLPLKPAGRRKRRSRPGRFPKKNTTSPKVVFEDENRKDSFLNVTPKKKLRSVKDGEVTGMQNGEIECGLTERISPPIITSSDIDQRRSSIDFQPVVRVMKIEDQVDMDHNILSVTVASNRRLRSSSSPRSLAQPPAKRFKTATGRGQIRRWLKNS